MDAYPDWDAIYRDNVERVYRLMYAKVGNRPDAEDLTTEVFMTALRPMRASASVGEVRAYLLATARTVLATFWRRTLGQEITTLQEERDVDLPTDDKPLGDTGASEVNRILAELPDRYRRILRLRFLEGCSIKEAAVELGVSVGNAKVLQHRALRQATVVAERMRT
ncbi:RNA polymerase sigma factor [Amycolatopsis alba]|uniref:RNA polymerase subunit sigma n=1 Tax=Amycolatopsis alba DSM 44262 TaxID=1125972 RepID=A0A229S7K3_AMYAL|nr:RNA polymerase subunit sigma [Amycolatopsis alba DSM 44262]